MTLVLHAVRLSYMHQWKMIQTVFVMSVLLTLFHFAGMVAGHTVDTAKPGCTPERSPEATNCQASVEETHRWTEEREAERSCVSPRMSFFDEFESLSESEEERLTQRWNQGWHEIKLRRAQASRLRAKREARRKLRVRLTRRLSAKREARRFKPRRCTRPEKDVSMLVEMIEMKYAEVDWPMDS